MRWTCKIRYASRTDVGFRRENNEDSMQVHMSPDQETWNATGHLFVVCDGMGGHAVGELASRIAVETVPDAYLKIAHEQPYDITSALRESLENANHTINQRGHQNPEFARMGTTCSALAIGPFGGAIGHVGDSRVYRVRGDSIDQLTFDHSLQWELARHGKVPLDSISAGTPKNVITRCLGPESSVEVDIEGPFDVAPHDRFVLCSDGLTNHVSDAEIGQIVANLSASEASRFLVDLANLRGGSDNSTVIVVEVEEDGQSPPQPPPATTRPRPTLISIIAGLVFTALVVAGVTLLSKGKEEMVAGGLLLAVALPPLVMMAIRSFRKAPPPDQPTAASGENVYQSESASLDEGFLNKLFELHDDIAAMLREQDADFRDDDATTSRDAAGGLLQSRDLRAALVSMARAIGACMECLVELRQKGVDVELPDRDLSD